MVSAFVFQADFLCEKCGEKQKKKLDKAGKKPEDVADENSFDSDDYPKGPYADGGGETDSPQHCRGCSTYLAAPLTDDGVNYVIEKIREFVIAKIAGQRKCGDIDVLRVWAEDIVGKYDVDAEEAFLINMFLEGAGRR